jgi:hypothetical protein
MNQKVNHNQFDLENIERLEYLYLMDFYHFLKFVERRMLAGFATKEKIKSDWISQWDPDEEGKGISSFAVGAERVVYALFNSQGFGQPNSSPVGSDLFFETEDAFIHIDMKTVQTRNIGDYNTSIFVGNNQNSYQSEIKDRNDNSFSPKRFYNPCLPKYYSYNNKVCLTYFLTILYDEDNLDILNINILSMPNGALQEYYGSSVLKAGKNLDKARFNFSKVDEFKLISGTPKRVKVIYFNENMEEKFVKKLDYLRSLHILQKDSLVTIAR